MTNSSENDRHISNAEIYDEIAPTYTKLIKDSQPTEDTHAMIFLLPQGGKLLDAGCAGRRDSRMFKANGLDVTGIDASEKMIEIARASSPGIPFSKGDFRHLEFPDGTFDGIWCTAALDHLDRKDIPLALGEFARCLKKGGYLFTSIRSGKGLLRREDQFSQKFTREFTLVTESEFREMLAAAGLTVDRLQNIPSKSRDGMSFLRVYSIK